MSLLPVNTTSPFQFSSPYSSIQRHRFGQQSDTSIPLLTVDIAPEASGDIKLEPSDKPGFFTMILSDNGASKPVGLIQGFTDQGIKAHITKNGVVMEVASRKVGQRYFIFPGGEYRSESGLFIKLWSPKRRDIPTLRNEEDEPPFMVQRVTHQALVPVGGQATRLQPLTSMVPKPAIPISANGKTLIGKVVEGLHNHGINHVIVTTRVMPDLIKKALNYLKLGQPNITYVQEKEALGDIGSLLQIMDKPQEYGLDLNKPLLIVQGDAYTKADFSQLLSSHHTHRSALTMAFKTVPDDQVNHFGILASDGSAEDGLSGNLQSFIEKPEPHETPHRNASTGIIVLAPQALQHLKDIHNSLGKPVKVNLAQHLLPELLKRIQAGELKNHRGQVLTAWAEKLSDAWMDVGRPDSYFEAHEGRNISGAVFWPGAQDNDAVTVAGNVISMKTN